MVEWGNYAEAYKAIHDKLNEILSKLDNPSDPTVQDIIDRAARQLGIISPSGDMAREVYYDRNPVVETEYYDSSQPQHGETTRWTYTVPANKKFECGVVFGIIKQNIATAGRKGEVKIKVNGSPVFQIIHTDGDGFATFRTVTATFLLLEGDAIRGDTNSNDTTTHVFTLGMVGTEFDE